MVLRPLKRSLKLNKVRGNKPKSKEAKSGKGRPVATPARAASPVRPRHETREPSSGNPAEHKRLRGKTMDPAKAQRIAELREARLRLILT